MSEHHKQKQWANHSKKARAIIKTQLPLPCVDCGSPVFPDQAWDVGHIVPLSQGGTAKDYGASHRSCNRSAGGKLAARNTNNIRKQTRQW